VTLLLSNEDVKKGLTMKDCVEAVEEVFKELGHGRAVNALRSEAILPCAKNPDAVYNFKLLQGGAPNIGYYAVRFSSDLWTYPIIDGKERLVRIPINPSNRFLGLVLLFSLETCELLAIMHGGYLQRMRVGATAAIGAKYLARPDAQTVGMIGSGGQARAQLAALCAVRNITRVKVYSTVEEHREKFAAEMNESLGVEIAPVDTARECIQDVDIVDLATSSRAPVLDGDWLEKGMHVHSLHWPEIDGRTYERSDVIVTNCRPYGIGRKENPYQLEYIMEGIPESKGLEHGFAHIAPDWENLPGLPELILGKRPGRTSRSQISLHLNHVGLGMQFAAAGGKAYEIAKKEGLGREIPSDWFLQDLQG
jgi:alanine dehydrogenase